jgi:hypothetical protein
VKVREATEPDGAASLSQKTNPANAGCDRRELSFQVIGQPRRELRGFFPAPCAACRKRFFRRAIIAILMRGDAGKPLLSVDF